MVDRRSGIETLSANCNTDQNLMVNKLYFMKILVLNDVFCCNKLSRTFTDCDDLATCRASRNVQS
jgi:hypothetical protein